MRIAIQEFASGASSRDGDIFDHNKTSRSESGKSTSEMAINKSASLQTIKYIVSNVRGKDRLFCADKAFICPGFCFWFGQLFYEILYTIR